MFSVSVVNTKVVDNFLILPVIKFHDFRPAGLGVIDFWSHVIKFHEFRPAGLGVIDFWSLLSGFACPLNRSEWLYCLTYLGME